MQAVVGVAGAGRTGLRISPVTPSNDAGPQPLAVPLSERELQVVRLLADGRSNREIARSLFLAEGTVKNHISTVLAKLDARDRTQAALKARALHLL